MVCATKGEAGEPAAHSGIGRDDLADARKGELYRAASMLGVTDVHLLDWRDSGMDGDAPAGSLVATSLDEVADRFATIIDEVQPVVVVTLDASDGHRDHVHVRDATLLAVDRADWSTPSVYLHCLPQDLMQAWAELIRADAPESAYLAVRQLGTPTEDITTVIDTESLIDRREAAIAAHVSQTSPYEVMPPDLRRAFLGSERLRRIRPEWEGGPVESELLSPTTVRAGQRPG